MSEQIRYITLENTGGFVAQIKVKGGSKDYNVGKDITMGVEQTVDLADAVGKIKEGDAVWLEVVVIAGYDKTAKERFIYSKSSNKKALYKISGTTLKSKLSYKGSEDLFTKIQYPIRGISLKNYGAFVSQIKINLVSGSYQVSQDICAGQEITYDLTEAIGKIKDGDEVWLEAVVKAGRSKTGKERFIYRKSSNLRASYTISGTTLFNGMSYDGTSVFYNTINNHIRFFVLKNTGGFVARINIKGVFGTYKVNKDICVGQESRIDLADVSDKIKDGDEVWLEAVVRAGSNKTASQRFTYSKTSDNKAYYSISGATLSNELSFKGVYKVGVSTSATPSKVHFINPNKTGIINIWENKKTACAWPGIEKSEIVEGLKSIVDQYFDSDKYTEYMDMVPSEMIKLNEKGRNTIVRTGIEQASGYSVCGPIAVMFYLAKINFETFVNTVFELYETGSLMGYNVPWSLRKLEEKTNKVEEKYQCSDPNIANVCWMFLASLAQKESIIDISLDMSTLLRDITQHTRHEEMVSDIKFVFNATNVTEQHLINWSSVSKAKNNLDKWISCLNNSGVVFWQLHSQGIKNIIYGKNEKYNHLLLDRDSNSVLHWVVVIRAQKTDKGVIVVLHTWGKLYRIFIPYEEFQKMSYTAIMFIVN